MNLGFSHRVSVIRARAEDQLWAELCDYYVRNSIWVGGQARVTDKMHIVSFFEFHIQPPVYFSSGEYLHGIKARYCSF